MSTRIRRREAETDIARGGEGFYLDGKETRRTPDVTERERIKGGGWDGCGRGALSAAEGYHEAMAFRVGPLEN